MAEQVKYQGRLIAVDGSRGRDTTAAAIAIVETLRKAGVECAVSQWDASGLFGELASAPDDGRDGISPRSLALVYAADLAFRLRWEIRPVLEAGGVVVAAPYVETAIALGAGYGVSEQWTRQLLRFAPTADWRGRAEERKVDRPWKRRTDRGFPEYCALMLDGSAKKRVSKRARGEMIRMLDQARGGKAVALANHGAEAIAKAITDSRTGGPRRSASRLRSARR